MTLSLTTCLTTQVDLLELFEEYGAVKHIFLPTNWKTNQGLGFAL